MKKRYTLWGAGGELLAASDQLRHCFSSVTSDEQVIIESDSDRAWRVRDMHSETRGKTTIMTAQFKQMLLVAGRYVDVG